MGTIKALKTVGWVCIITIINAAWWVVAVFLYSLFKIGVLPKALGFFDGVFFLLVIPIVVTMFLFHYFKNHILINKEQLKCAITFTTVLFLTLTILSKHLPKEFTQIFKDENSWGMALTVLLLQGLLEYYTLQNQKEVFIMDSPYMTIEEAADYFKIPKETMYLVVKVKDFPAAKVGRHWRIRRDRIDCWWEKRFQEKPENV